MTLVWFLVPTLTALAGAATVGLSGAGSASCDALAMLRSLGDGGADPPPVSSSAGSIALRNAVATAIAPTLRRAFTALETSQCRELENLLNDVVAGARLTVGGTLDKLSLFVNDDRVLGPLAPVLGAAIRVVEMVADSVLVPFSAPAGVCDVGGDDDDQSSGGGVLPDATMLAVVDELAANETALALGVDGSQGNSTFGEVLASLVGVSCDCLAVLLYLTVQLLRAVLELVLEILIALVSNLGLGDLGAALVNLQVTVKDIVHNALTAVAEVLVPENVCGALE